MSEDSPSGLSLPGFRIIQRIGEGGMGVVYLAEDLELSRRVAVKAINEASRAGAAARFAREARLMATVEHPAIVRVYSLVHSESSSYLIMEYVEGESLAEKIKREGALDPAEAIRILNEVIDGLEAAWENGIVHRDIKPSNILLDKKNRARVADFGLAKPIKVDGDSTLTRDGVVLGTPHYVSPEQILGKETDFRSDIYSLGILLYEMLTGEKPFSGSTPFEIIQKNLTEPLPQLRTKNPNLNLNFQILLDLMTAKNPEDRPSSYRELRAKAGGVSSGTEKFAAIKPEPVRVSSVAVNWLSQVVTLIFFLCCAWLIYSYLFPSKSVPPPANERQSYLVAVTPFYGPDETSAREGRIMSSLIENAIQERLGKESQIAGIESTAEPVRNEESARSLARRLNARIVIWGEVHSIAGETEIDPFVTLNTASSGEAARIGESKLDPFLPFTESGPGRVVVKNEAPDQIGLRRTTAAAIGDLVSFLAGVNALYIESDPQKALHLFEQSKTSPQSFEYRARSLIALNRTADAQKLLENATASGIEDASLYALLGDLRFGMNDLAGAVRAYQKANDSGKSFKTSRAILHNGRIVYKETYTSKRFTDGRLLETPFVLSADPESGKLLQRYRVPGTVLFFDNSGDELNIIYDAGISGSPLEASLKLADLKDTQMLEADAGLRLQSIESGMVLAANFLPEMNSVSPETIAKFQLRDTTVYDDAPDNLPDLEIQLRQKIENDPTQPWSLFLLGQCLQSQGKSSEAAATFESLFKDNFPSTAYFEFSAMAAMFELFGQFELADHAYQQALLQRKKNPAPIQIASYAERLASLPFWMMMPEEIKNPERKYSWRMSTLELTGISPQTDLFTFAGWNHYFREKDHPMKEKSEQIFGKVEANPLNIVKMAAYLDYAVGALVGAAAGFLFMTAVMLIRLLRFATQRSKRQDRNPFSAITKAERAAFIASAVVMVICLTIAIYYNVRLQSLLSIPALTMDSPGNPYMVSVFESRLSDRDSESARFSAAVVNHRAGNRARAAELYKTVSDERAQRNLAALEGGTLIPPEPLMLSDVEKTFRAHIGSSWLEILSNPARGLNLFGLDERSDPEKPGVAVLLFHLSILFAAFLTIQFVLTRTEQVNAQLEKTEALGFAGAGRRFLRVPFGLYFSISLISFVIFVLLVQLLIPHKFPVCGIVSLILLSGLPATISFPPALSQAADPLQYYYWTLFFAYPGALFFWLSVAVSAIISIVISFSGHKLVRK